MKSCPKCLNLSPDTAPACEQCGTVLDESVIARAGGKTNFRSPTMMEPPSTPRPSPPPLSYRPSPPPPPPCAAPPPPSAAPTPPVGAPRAGRRGETVYIPPPQSGAAAGAAPALQTPRPADRRIIGILVTYSWKPEGQIFPVREGRNLIGRGEHCEIHVPEDPVLSNENSHITFRKTFVVGDMLSMSGTYLDGEPIEEQFRPLPNYSKIVTGSTQWTFVMLHPPSESPGMAS